MNMMQSQSPSRCDENNMHTGNRKQGGVVSERN